MASIEEIKQEAADAKMREKAGKAYDRALTTTEPAPAPVVKKAKGGTASARADGIAQRGKTRGTLIMCGGGYMKGKK